MSITSNNLEVREIIHQVVNDPDYREVSFVPVFSIHQLALILIAYGGVFGGIWMIAYGGVSLWIVYPIMVFAFYTAFTPLHDSTHRAVSSNNLLNDVLGTISGFLLFPLSNAVGYRYLHLAHHRYVGDKDLDPDEPLVAIPTHYFPWGYISLLFPDFVWAHWLLFKVWKRTPVKTRFNVLSMIVGNTLFHIAWFLSPFWYGYLILFFIPNRLAIAYTALTFAHNPHPEGIKWNDKPFKTTFTLTGSNYFLWSLYGQSHHAMHHFLPHIPWYKYFKVWDLANGAFKKKNIPEKNVFSMPDPHYKEKIMQDSDSTVKEKLKVKVVAIENVAKNIKSFVFEAVENEDPLPEFSAGSHIKVQLPSGKIRAYSCVNPTYEKNKYQIAVKLDPNGKGGSKEMHEHISVGQQLEITPPKNNFVLYENVKKYILFAGGIGITPLLSMAHRLTEIEKFFELHVCVKSKEEVPFQYALTNWTFAPNVEIHVDKEGKSTMDINRILAHPDEDTLIYVCGPSGYNSFVKQRAIDLGWKNDHILQEVFSRDNSNLSTPHKFELILNKSKKSIVVKEDETIIDALHLNNIKVPYSCLQGTCGTCITNVIEGEVDHRDAVLNEEEKMEHKKMCLCVSRAKKNKLIVDI
ncbi:MAG: fatty acid desaturase [Saprospiraceae bacterium]|nr:fatty acid desaturase [Saprospiraceae bacterium]